MGRHAYLIVAHHQWALLKVLLLLLDDERNDIYVHVDKRKDNVPNNELQRSINKSKLFFVDRIPVHRGSFTLFEAEMILLRTALRNGDYTYFHLLSGQDLPLKSQDYIHSFFEKNDGKNFIDVITPDLMKKDWYERVALYQPFSRYTLGKPFVAIPAKFARRFFLYIQKMLRVNRLKLYENQGLILCYGSNWFSITKAFAKYIVDNESFIRKVFQKYTFAPEELIPQTLLWSSEFRSTLYSSEKIDGKLQRANLRAIFWNGSTSPETISLAHLEKISGTINLFARKFDLEKCPEAIEAVFKMIT